MKERIARLLERVARASTMRAARLRGLIPCRVCGADAIHLTSPATIMQHDVVDFYPQIHAMIDGSYRSIAVERCFAGIRFNGDVHR